MVLYKKGKNKSVSFLVSELIGRLRVPVSFLIGQVSCSYYRRLRKTKTAIALKPAVFGRLPVLRPLTLGASGTTAGRRSRPHLFSPLQRARRFSRQISSSLQTRNIMAQANVAPDPEYTELGIKIHKFRFTLRVQRRTPTPSMTSEDGVSTTTPRSRTNSTASSIADSLGLLNLDQPPRSRRPIATNSNWEFYPMRTSTPSSGYNSTASVSRTSSFSTTSKSTTSKRLTSTDDSAYSEVYSTIEELSELADPFDPEPTEKEEPKQPQPLKFSHQKTPSSSSTIAANFSNHSGTLRKNSTLPPKPAPRPAPPLPPRINQSRPPARPPYPSSHVKQKSM